VMGVLDKLYRLDGEEKHPLEGSCPPDLDSCINANKIRPYCPFLEVGLPAASKHSESISLLVASKRRTSFAQRRPLVASMTSSGSPSVPNVANSNSLSLSSGMRLAR
jgi:hypothetical protein